MRPECLAIEVTETALIHDPGRSGRELARLSSAGIRISLDDFGTGYSSLSWLTQFPVDIVKIDKSFTDDVGIDERKTAIISAVIAVSHELGFTVVAEGIESEEQGRRLLDLGCDRGQGYFYGRPTSIEEDPWTAVDAPLYLIAIIRPRMERAAEVEVELRALMAGTHAEPGCIHMELVVSDDDPTTWLMLEKFRSRPDWEDHMRTDARDPRQREPGRPAPRADRAAVLHGQVAEPRSAPPGATTLALRPCPPQRPHQHLRRLGPGHRVPPVDHEERHPRHLQLPGLGLVRPHRVEVAIGRQHLVDLGRDPVPPASPVERGCPGSPIASPSVK